LEGIKNVSAARDRFKSKMKLELQFLVNKYNEHQIPDAERFAKEVKASFKLKSMQVVNSRDAGKWMPSDKRYVRYENAGGKYTLRNSMPARCLRLWLNPVVTWDGKVVPCCFDKDADYVMGDLNNDSFRSIWNGDKFKEFRKKVLTERGKTDICRNCTSGMRGIRF
ncbi:MAG TPA: SPASM domain-containing protein, partial [Bacteroidales bacterium]|nr:SPASM domain-containing protein [Bacteroidales bacterium]